jgi:hypothetical protein
LQFPHKFQRCYSSCPSPIDANQPHPGCSRLEIDKSFTAIIEKTIDFHFILCPGDPDSKDRNALITKGMSTAQMPLWMPTKATQTDNIAEKLTEVTPESNCIFLMELSRVYMSLFKELKEIFTVAKNLVIHECCECRSILRYQCGKAIPLV